MLPSCRPVQGLLTSGFLSLSSSTPARFFSSLVLVLDNVFVRTSTHCYAAIVFLLRDANTRLSIHSLHCFTAILFLFCETATKAHDYSYPAFSMPKAERRRWIETHLSRHSETSAFLPGNETKNGKKAKCRKSASFEDDDEVVPIARPFAGGGSAIVFAAEFILRRS